ncbi:MAG: hypothetical protein EOP24_26215 [Hyphomicrobiales bacterium]|nr:MAG: hypothetical protein EOP24_26215 [Hyphomicrobiales bacterium]
MTRTHAALQLLRLGPLTRADFIEITGWGVKRADKILQWLRETGRVEYRGTSQRGLYRVAA